MGLRCLFGHDWDGCKCKKCGKTRDVTSGTSEKNILEQYREGLQYLNDCSGVFTEADLREFNRIIGNRFPESHIASLLSDSKMMIRGMEDVKKLLKDNMSEGIAVFEQLEKSGIDLSAYAGKI